jgi:hypothetical protein
MLGSSRVAAQLAASQEGLGCMSEYQFAALKLFSDLFLCSEVFNGLFRL